MNKTKIEYLDYSWNPLAMRCTPVSEGCANCWHIAIARRMANNPKIAPELREAYSGDFPPVLIESRLNDPERLRKPSIIGVQFMGDLFHASVTFSTVELIMKTVLHCQHHTFVFLTKRPQRMAKYFRWAAQNSSLVGFQPPSNAMLGVTVENEPNAWRIQELLQIPAAHGKLFVSYEPALGPLELGFLCKECGAYYDYSELRYSEGDCLTEDCRGGYDQQFSEPGLVIAGCESGPKHRPANTDWFRSVRDQCQEAGVPFFLKQMEIGGKVVSMPELDGRAWKEWPK